MKKILLVILFVLLLAVTPVILFARPAAVSKNALKGVSHSESGSFESIIIKVDSFTSYNTIRLPDPDRIVVDIVGASAPGKQQVLEIGSAFVQTVRYAQFEPNIARVVINAKEEPDFRVEKVAGGLSVIIGRDVSQPVDPQSTQAKPVIAKKKVAVNDAFSLEYDIKADVDEISLLLSGYKNYKVFRLTGPDRIVVDIPNYKAAIKDNKITVNGSQITSVRWSKYENETARVVFDLTGQSHYSISEKEGCLAIRLEAPKYKNISYSNNGDRVYLTLSGTQLTETNETLTKFYTESYDQTGKKYTLTYPSGKGDLGEGILLLNDDYLDSVEIKKDAERGVTSIIFNGKGKLSYVPFYRKELGNTNITIIKPAGAGDKYVAIDPGHGGIKPGAIYGSLKEKDLNLDIAKRLDKLLEAKKVKTYMLREDDSHVDNWERAYIANALGAKLFISIHNNALDDPAYGGTMTLCYPQSGGGFNGRTFAQLIHGRLLQHLKTTDRKIIERPNLVVLRGTSMPAALAEIAFITNKKDRTNLLNVQFRDKAALALSEAVIQALDRV